MIDITWDEVVKSLTQNNPKRETVLIRPCGEYNFFEVDKHKMKEVLECLTMKINLTKGNCSFTLSCWNLLLFSKGKNGISQK